MQNIEIKKDDTLSEEIKRMSDKELSEVRSECISKLKEIQAKLKEENRQLTVEEDNQCNGLAEKIKMIDSTVKSRGNIQNDYNKISDVLNQAEGSADMFKASAPDVTNHPEAVRAQSAQAYSDVYIPKFDATEAVRAQMSRTYPDLYAPRLNFIKYKDNYSQYLRELDPDTFDFTHRPDHVHSYCALRAMLSHQPVRIERYSQQYPEAVRAHMKLADLGDNIKKFILAEAARDLFDISFILNQCTLVTRPGSAVLPKLIGKCGNLQLHQYTSGDEKPLQKIVLGRDVTNPVQFSMAAGIEGEVIEDSDIDIIQFITGLLNNLVHFRIEKALTVGFDGEAEGDGHGRILGLTEVDNVVTTKNVDSIEPADLNKTRSQVQNAYGAPSNIGVLRKCVWIMSISTYLALQDMHDKNGRSLYLPENQASVAFFQPNTILNCPVYCPASMPDIEAGKTVAYFGDLSALAVHMATPLHIDMPTDSLKRLNLAEMHPYIRFDTKLIYPNQLVKLVMKGE